MTEAGLYDFMTRHRLGVLASVGEAGHPQSALVGFAVTPQLELVFDTVKSSRKYSNLLRHSTCSFVIGCTDEQTLQYEGDANELDSSDLEPFRQIYLQAWPECASHVNWPRIAYFLVRPAWIRYSDFDQNPPLIKEFRFL